MFFVDGKFLNAARKSSIDCVSWPITYVGVFSSLLEKAERSAANKQKIINNISRFFIDNPSSDQFAGDLVQDQTAFHGCAYNGPFLLQKSFLHKIRDLL